MSSHAQSFPTTASNEDDQEPTRHYPVYRIFGYLEPTFPCRKKSAKSLFPTLYWYNISISLARSRHQRRRRLLRRPTAGRCFLIPCIHRHQVFTFMIRWYAFTTFLTICLPGKSESNSVIGFVVVVAFPIKNHPGLSTRYAHLSQPLQPKTGP